MFPKKFYEKLRYNAAQNWDSVPISIRTEENMLAKVYAKSMLDTLKQMGYTVSIVDKDGNKITSPPSKP